LIALYVPTLAAAGIHIRAFDRLAGDPARLLAQATGASGSSGLLGFLPLILIFVVFYFVLIRPQQTRQKKWQQVLTTLKAGDRVVTTGGMRGTIISVKDDSFLLRVPPDNLRMEVMKVAVASLETEEGKA
jgi:preprotein translocase subunit YajC